MASKNEIFRRIAQIQADLGVLMQAIADWDASSESSAPAPAPAPRPAAPAPAPAPAPTPAPTASQPEPKAPAPEPTPAPEPKKKVRWSYQPGTWYRIVGDNPFRNGNNYNLFEYLSSAFGAHPFSRTQLGEAFEALKDKGLIETVQEEKQYAIGFLSTAGARKGRIEMTEAPSEGAKTPEPPSEVIDLPPEPGDTHFRLDGDSPFRSGINQAIWERLGARTFTRDELVEVIEGLVDEGAIDSARPPVVIGRDFFGRIQAKGRVAAAS